VGEKHAYAQGERRSEEFSERGPDFLTYVQQMFPGGRKFWRGEKSPLRPSCYGPGGH